MEQKEMIETLLNSQNCHCIPTFVPYTFQKEVWNRAAAAVLEDRCKCENKEECIRCNNKCKRFILVWHRRSGKDFLCWQFVVWTALASKKPRQIFYCLPTFSQCRRVIFESKDLEGKSFISVIPKAFIDKINSQDLTIHLVNGSVISLISSNSYDKIRGANAYLIVLSEFAFYAPTAQREIMNAVLPIVERNQGIVIINSTPNSRNYFYELFMKARENDDWYTSLVTIKDTGLISEESVKKIVDTGIMSDAKARQEFYCDFEISESTIYANEMSEARATNRIGKVFADSNSSLCCAFDLGWADASFGVIYEYNRESNTIKIIDEISGTKKPFLWYLGEIRNKSYSHRITDIFLPVDAKKHNQNDGGSIYKTARDTSTNWHWYFRTHIVESNQLLHMQIDFCRMNFPRVWINEQNCPQLLICLDNYSMAYDEKNNIYTKPKHDQYSHGASAFSYAMMSMRKLGKSSSVELDKQLFEQYRPAYER